MGEVHPLLPVIVALASLAVALNAATLVYVIRIELDARARRAGRR